MEININDQKKIVEIWLANSEKESGQAQARIQNIAENYRPKKYTVAVFKSGERDLFEQTQGLLMHNRMLEPKIKGETAQSVEQEMEQCFEDNDEFKMTL